MQDKILFRKAFQGYNRDDVNKYIIESDAKFKKTLADKDERIKILEDKVFELEEKEKTPDPETVRKIDEQTSEIQELKEEIEKLKLLLEESEAGKLKDGEVLDKSSKYDKVSGQIGDMIVSATANAEAIVAKAQAEAKAKSDEIMEKASETLKKLNDTYSEKIKTKAADITERLKLLAEETANFCRETKEEIEKTKELTMENLQDKNDNGGKRND